MKNSQILIIPVTPLLYIADNFNTSDNKAFKSHYTESLANMLDQFVTVFWHRTGCVFVILNCLSPDSVSCFHHIVLERCQTSGFPKLTSCWRLCDCGASSFMWQQHPPPRPKCAHMHALPHTHTNTHTGTGGCSVKQQRREDKSHAQTCSIIVKLSVIK